MFRLPLWLPALLVVSLAGCAPSEHAYRPPQTARNNMARIAPPPPIALGNSYVYVSSVDGTPVHCDPIVGHQSIYVSPGEHRVMLIAPGARRTSKELVQNFQAGRVYKAKVESTPEVPTRYYFESSPDKKKN